jgi:hypothetical protein
MGMADYTAVRANWTVRPENAFEHGPAASSFWKYGSEEAFLAMAIVLRRTRLFS